MGTRFKAVLTAALFFAGVNAAMAASPVGQWNVTFYVEPTLAKAATQGICYRSAGSWFSTTLGGWHGAWFQDGERFRWFGTAGSLGTAEFGQISSANLATGEVAHFDAVTGGTITVANWIATKVGNKCLPPASSAARGGRDPAKP